MNRLEVRPARTECWPEHWEIYTRRYNAYTTSSLEIISVKQECIPVGCIPSATVAVCWGGGVAPGVVSGPRGFLLQGVPPPGGCLLLGVVSQHALRQNPPLVDRQTGVKT